MTVLALDTTGRACSAALVSQSGLLASRSEIIGRGHAEYLAPQVQTLFRLTGLSPRDLTRIAVCTGPGSFTGLRVAIAMAKGMALPLGIPVIGMSALELWAAMADPEQARRVLSVADVRRGELFWQVFENGQAKLAPVLSQSERARENLTPDTFITGNGAEHIGGIAAPRLDPAVLGWLALEKSAQDYPADPLYHRPPDAKLPGGRPLPT